MLKNSWARRALIYEIDSHKFNCGILHRLCVILVERGMHSALGSQKKETLKGIKPIKVTKIYNIIIKSSTTCYLFSYS
ncbi:hypothetical protein EEL30_12125 [Brevibacillus laterosporus]|uniref:Uncharacterized protein n=1 Tax=Brevibacillus laterosporus TaxID=1465 RepID=A0A518V7M9_BRELA|nr:hypothetical protein EEL30_12125 [Brevibacillus laterosporus]